MNLEDSQIPLADVIDVEILMHRDAHFGGNFDIMIDYYKNKGVGVMPDFSLHRIEELKKIEEKMEKNLSQILLPSAAVESVENAKRIYLTLRKTYEEAKPSESTLTLSNLILSEEEVPSEEISAVVSAGKEVVPPLIHLISSQDFYDPLFPGYGRAPIFAAQCLAEIGDESAIAPLFEALGQDNFYTDDAIIKALSSYGEKAKSFLFKILEKEPLSKDNDHAAIALSGFPEDLEIAKRSLKLLKKESVQKRESLAPYLIFACSPLESSDLREQFSHLLQSEHLSKDLKHEIKSVIKSWI